MYKPYKLLAIILIWSVSQSISAQLSNIKLIDKNNQEPIIGAIYQYGATQGISDETGTIQITLKEDLSLQISHINYRDLRYSYSELQKAVVSGILSISPKSHQLYPVTIVSLGTDRSDIESITVQADDHLEHDGAELLRATPVISGVRKSGSYGYDPVLRGFKYDQISIVYNGAQSATAACPNRMDPPTSQIAPYLLDKIEIYKGPHALRYGSSIGGTVNFVGGQVKYSDQLTPYGQVSSEYQSNGNVLRTQAQAGLSTSSLDWKLYTAISTGDDYMAGDGQSVAADFSRQSYGTRLHLKLSDAQELSISSVYNRARDIDYPALAMDLRKDDTYMLNAEHRWYPQSSTISSVKTQVYGSYVNHLMDNLLKNLNPRMLNAATEAKSHNYGLRSEATQHVGDNELYYGIDYRVEGTEGIRSRAFLMGPNAGKTLYDNAWQDGQINRSAAFASYQIIRPSTQYSLSARLEHNSGSIQDPSAEFVSIYPDTEVTQINPSISLGMNTELSEKWSVGIYVARAQSSAGLTERYINSFAVGLDPHELMGNPELSPEINNEIDINLSWGKNEKNEVTLDLFTSYVQDYISSLIDPNLSPTLHNSPGVRRYTNIDAALRYGAEIDWQLSLHPKLSQRVSMAYTYGQDLDIDAPLPEIAPLDMRYSLRGIYAEGRIRPSLDIRHVIAQERVSTVYGETLSSPFSLIDLGITLVPASWYQIKVAVENVLDTHYYEHLNRSVRGSAEPIYDRGRNITASLSVKW